MISPADAEGRATWTQDRGAFFLPNIDDDLEQCPVAADDGSQLSDVELASCNDAADDVVNGDEDVADLARIAVQPVDTTAVQSVHVELLGVGAAKTRVFVNTGTGADAADWVALSPDGTLPGELVGAGVELGIEGKDIIRDSSWDGSVKVRVTHLDATAAVIAADEVEMRATPLLFQTDLMPIRQLFAADNATSVYAGRGEIEPTASTQRTRLTAVPFQADIRAGVARINQDVEFKLLPSLEGARGGGTGTDVWAQDIMEPGFMTLATPEGEHGMAVFVRAPVRDGRDNGGVNPFRQTGRVIFTELRGRDVAGVQHFDPDYVPAAPTGNSSYDTFGSTGNYGTVPPHRSDGIDYPVGRKLFGSVDGYTADPSFNAMLMAQGFQDPIVVNTSWLRVGHIDEVVSFIPANNKLGWAMVAADPQLGFDLLRRLRDEGRGDEPLLNAYGFN
ncbi:MAG: protein-arginine deiminase domain-containing protein, partial [Bifidobacteriaceae bacterium]|nr:protein-arginine deiminase domain-containing protein [Bifidobacteriaceae bacterium]